jgi:hypothetical protein
MKTENTKVGKKLLDLPLSPLVPEEPSFEETVARALAAFRARQLAK